MVNANSSEAMLMGAIKSGQIQSSRREERIREYSDNPNRCKTCDSILDYDKRHNKFCSRSCSAKNNNLGVCRVEKKTRSEEVCLTCQFPLAGNQDKYCSTKCKSEFEWQSRKAKITASGVIDSPRVSKRYLLETRGHRCEICNLTEWQGQPIPLVKDHIDGNSENNLITNLRLVCGNCDMQLPTYKSKNRGNGRAFRRQRYADGKSY